MRKCLQQVGIGLVLFILQLSNQWQDMLSVHNFIVKLKYDVCILHMLTQKHTT